MKNLLTTALAFAFCAAAPVLADPAEFDTPQDALEAMVEALRAQDRAMVLAVFGDEAEDYLSDGDPVEDRLNRLVLLGLYEEGYRMVPQPDGSVMLAMGAEGWLFPVPLAKNADAKWAFDNEAGREEVLLREIGGNELDVIELMQAYVEIQAEFRQTDYDGDGVMEFASRIISTSSERPDGLFWAEEGSLMGELFARAVATGYSDGETDHEPEPFSGYFFRILTEQSDAAPGGMMDYMVNDNMVGGHALIAVPAVFGETGVHSFMISENGILLQTVWGEETLDKAATVTSYDPNEDWEPLLGQ